MTRYAIIGNGVAGTTAAFTLRARDERAAIALIGGESDYFFSRTALMYAYMDRMNLRDLEPFERGRYAAARIDLKRGWVADLDADAHRLRLADGTTIEYDRLLIATGSAPHRPEWEGLGEARQGVVHFVSQQDLAQCEALTPSTRRAAVVGGGLIGVELVECLRHHGVEVEFLVREPWYWAGALRAGEGELVREEIERHGVTLRLGEQVEQVRTERSGGRVSGVRTASGRQIECQMLGICTGVRPAVEWLKGVTTPPALDRGVAVGRGFRTSLKDVWAAGDCAAILRGANQPPLIEPIWYAAKRQGELAARAMTGDEIDYQPPVFYNSAKFFELEYTTVGETAPPPRAGAREFFHRFGGRRASLRVVERGGAVCGFTLLGARWNHRVLERWIAERRSLDDTMATLERAQFDVEFGRLPLDGARAAYAQWRGQEVTA